MADSATTTPTDAESGAACAERARAPAPWNRALFVVGMALMLAFNAALVGAVLASVSVRQQEGGLDRDGLIALLYTGVWCGTMLAVASAVVEAWRDRQRYRERDTASGMVDGSCQHDPAMHFALAGRIGCDAQRDGGPNEVLCGMASARGRSWHIVTWHGAAPLVATGAPPTGENDRVPFEVRGTRYITWTQPHTVPLLLGGDDCARGPEPFSETIESVRRGHKADLVRCLQTPAVWPPQDSPSARHDMCAREPLAFPAEAEFYAHDDGHGDRAV
ncbi:hypothetical protein pkur_cds_11 [Pandoravirus kuranda]|uniref:Uncharacterized protein n=1 Tax=Pandoravirus kuranda TaxID=3019033 RepID=A0AA95EMG3_9VIRU|nr:hypothetical protein pkur_cds_11 [Pandoravirus kuranda]